MFNIASYLKKAAGLLNEADIRKSFIIDAFKQQGIELAENNFTLKNGVLRVNLSPVEKNIIFIKRRELLEKLKDVKVREIV